MKIKKGDRVQVLSGKDRGEEGVVMRVFPKTNRIIVEGVNVAKKHHRQTKSRVKGGIIDKDMPMSASAVTLLCSTDGPTRASVRVNADGTRTRVCRKCGKDL